MTPGSVSRLVRVVVPALMLLAAPAGCIKHSVIPDEPDVITISVSNSNPLDMTVYAVNQSMRIRLGTVSTASNEKARRLLGWSPRSNEDALIATANSLVALGLVTR